MPPPSFSTSVQKRQMFINRRLLYGDLKISSFGAFTYFKKNWSSLSTQELPQKDFNFIEVKCIVCFLLLQSKAVAGDEFASLLLESLLSLFDLLESELSRGEESGEAEKVNKKESNPNCAVYTIQSEPRGL